MTHLRYVLSPRPKHVYLSWLRHPGGNLLRRSFRQKSSELCGMSPWPVVDMTNTTKRYSSSELWRSHGQRAVDRLEVTSLIEGWLAHKVDSVHLVHAVGKMQSCAQTAELLGHVPGIARLGAIEHEDAPVRVRYCHGGVAYDTCLSHARKRLVLCNGGSSGWCRNDMRPVGSLMGDLRMNRRLLRVGHRCQCRTPICWILAPVAIILASWCGEIR